MPMLTNTKKVLLFYITYPFMWRDLNLSGISRDVFAIIFGFWKKGRSPVHVPYSVIREMTGATDPSISAAIKKLKKRELIVVTQQKQGLKSLYQVSLPAEVLAEFMSEYMPREESEQGNETLRTSLKQVAQDRRNIPPSSSYNSSENTIP